MGCVFEFDKGRVGYGGYGEEGGCQFVRCG